VTKKAIHDKERYNKQRRGKKEDVGSVRETKGEIGFAL